MSLLGLGIKVILFSQKVFLSLGYLEELRRVRVGVSFSLNVWWNSFMKPSGPGLLFARSFLITASIPLAYSDFLIFPDWFLEGCVFITCQ